MTQRKFHAVAELFPLMQGAALAELVADIKKNGPIEPILVERWHAWKEECGTGETLPVSLRRAEDWRIRPEG